MKSKGLGDTIEKITAATGIKKAVEFATKSSGEGCVPCSERKKKLNDPKLLVNKVFYKTNNN
jgi:hypothetical protein